MQLVGKACKQLQLAAAIAQMCCGKREKAGCVIAWEMLPQLGLQDELFWQAPGQHWAGVHRQAAPAEAAPAE